MDITTLHQQQKRNEDAMSFKSKQEIFDEGCDALIDVELKYSVQKCKTYLEKNLCSLEHLESLLSELLEIKKKADHYRSLKTK